ncbi:hypothetical protein M513_00528 [Trichuris suis]|uniref:Uncharacterized protein n=1 Tax=Trichuris suis TaxID=68888 RepID=A0A085MNN9_9BILA|nr:hypothetical protein M513_00528 [Trichuris suis]
MRGRKREKSGISETADTGSLTLTVRPPQLDYLYKSVYLLHAPTSAKGEVSTASMPGMQAVCWTVFTLVLTTSMTQELDPTMEFYDDYNNVEKSVEPIVIKDSKRLGGLLCDENDRYNGRCAKSWWSKCQHSPITCLLRRKRQLPTNHY